MRSRTNAEASGTTNSSCEEPGVAAHQMTAVGRLRQLNRGPANGWIRRIEVIVPRVGNWPEMAPQQTLVRFDRKVHARWKLPFRDSTS
jgi:hypothetical protein